jgi:outer membrane protein assembly factor BamB
MGIVANELYAVGFQGRLGAMDVTTGRVLWARKMSSYSGLSVARTQLYLTDSEDGVIAVDRRNGGTLWRQDKLARRQLSGPASVGDYAVVGDFDGYLHWLDEEDGSIVGRSRVDGSPVLMPPLAIGSTLYVLSSGGTLAAFREAG